MVKEVSQLNAENTDIQLEGMRENSKTWPRKLKHVLLTATLGAFSCCIAYGIGELIVRLWFAEPVLPRYLAIAPYGVSMNMPNQNFWQSSHGYHVNVRTNSRGLRSDKEIPYEKHPGVFRILGVGDSFTLGYEVDLEDTFLYQLEQKLHEKGARNVEVINLGIGGFGTEEELLTLEYEGFKYSPDLVLLQYFQNDLNDNLNSNLFFLKGDTLQREARTYLPAVKARAALSSIPGYRWLTENSQLLNVVRNRISWLMKGAMNKKRNEMLAARVRSGNPTKGGTGVASYEEMLAARLLDEIYKECDKRGIPLLILDIPLIKLSSKDISTNIPIHLMQLRNKVIFVEAGDILAPYRGKREIHWEEYSGHWRPWVHHLVAAALADTIMTHCLRSGNRKISIQSPY
jgi:hypothetical protein